MGNFNDFIMFIQNPRADAKTIGEKLKAIKNQQEDYLYKRAIDALRNIRGENFCKKALRYV